MRRTTVSSSSSSGKGAGVWDSIHVFEAVDRARTAHYRLTSTVILHLSAGTDALGELDLSGNMTRQVELDLPVENDASHVANVGKMVEDMEFKLRNLLREYLWQSLWRRAVCWMVGLRLGQRRCILGRRRMLWAI